jgi:hypothetical protein
MVAAAMTVWTMFSVWLIAYCADLPGRIGRMAMGLLLLELVMLGIWSYGSENCLERTCAPLAQAAGIAARTDVPILAALFVACASISLGRSGRGAAGPPAASEPRRGPRRTPASRRAR